MKIALSQDEIANLATSGSQMEALTQAVSGCRVGDWEAKRNLERLFNPLITMLAARRAGADTKVRNELIERGRAGLYRAAKRFPRRENVRRFRLFALDYIQTEMEKPARSGLRKLFG